MPRVINNNINGVKFTKKILKSILENINGTSEIIYINTNAGKYKIVSILDQNYTHYVYYYENDTGESEYFYPNRLNIFIDQLFDERIRNIF